MRILYDAEHSCLRLDTIQIIVNDVKKKYSKSSLHYKSYLFATHISCFFQVIALRFVLSSTLPPQLIKLPTRTTYTTGITLIAAHPFYSSIVIEAVSKGGGGGGGTLIVRSKDGDNISKVSEL